MKKLIYNTLILLIFVCYSFVSLGSEFRSEKESNLYQTNKNETAEKPFEDEFKQAVKYFENKEYKEAFSLFKKTAKLGDGKSAYNLAIMYEHGVGGKKEINLMKASFWYNKSVLNGYTHPDVDSSFARCLKKMQDKYELKMLELHRPFTRRTEVSSPASLINNNMVGKVTDDDSFRKRLATEHTEAKKNNAIVPNGNKIFNDIFTPSYMKLWKDIENLSGILEKSVIDDNLRKREKSDLTLKKMEDLL